jgi:hypothetical protein
MGLKGETAVVLWLEECLWRSRVSDTRAGSCLDLSCLGRDILKVNQERIYTCPPAGFTMHDFVKRKNIVKVLHNASAHVFAYIQLL